MSPVTRPDDPRGIPVGYGDPDTTDYEDEPERLQPSDVEGKIVVCDQHDEEIEWREVDNGLD